MACGGGEDVRRMLAAAAMMGAGCALVISCRRDYSWGSCVASADGRVNMGSVGEDGATESAAESARPCDLRQCTCLCLSSLVCSRASSASLGASSSTDMRGLVVVAVRTHSGTTYRVLNMDNAGRDSRAAMDVAIVAGDSEEVGARCAVFGGERKEAATRALSVAKRPAFTCRVCGGDRVREQRPRQKCGSTI